MLNALDRCYISTALRIHRGKEKAKEAVHKWRTEELGGTSTVVIEIVMVGMILVLGYIFRGAIADLFASLWNSLIKFNDSAEEPSISAVSNPFG